MDLDRFLEEHPHHPEPAVEIVYKRVIEAASDIFPASQTRWFHFTRTHDAASFKSGLLPLPDRLDAIWSYLGELSGLSVSDWSSFRRSFESSSSWDAELYRMKVGDRLHWGPFAFLISEYAFHPHEATNHDYLRTPEIVEDIANECETRLGIDLNAQFNASTNPVIVTFTTEGMPDYCLRAAIYHLYSMRTGHGWSREASTGFDGGGKPVPPSNIHSVRHVRSPRPAVTHFAAPTGLTKTHAQPLPG